MIDTHCHLYLPEFDGTIDESVLSARQKGVSAFYLPAIDSKTHKAVLLMEEKYPGICFAMMGLHPCSVNDNYASELLVVEQYFRERSFAAVGEIGLDFYWDTTFRNQQYDAFHRQIELALTYNRPIVVHSRNATDDCIDVVKQYTSKGLRGVFHCFGGTLWQAEAIINLGFYLGIGGVITYKNAGVAEVVAEIPLAHLVLETDAPYLTPVPFRGKRNESYYLPIIAEKIAAVKNCEVSLVEQITNKNATTLFSGYE